MDEAYLITTLCLVPLILISLIVSAKVNITFRKFSDVHCSVAMTAGEAARRMLDNAGLYDVNVVMIQGNLTDNYNPKTRTVSLSTDVYNSNSVAAMGVMAHEVGHVMQYKDEYVPIKIRSALVPVCNISSKAALPLLLIGMMIEIFVGTNTLSNLFFFLGVAFYGVYTLFALVTLPVEYNASSRARKLLLDNGVVLSQDEKKVKEMLNAAAMTYVMSFAVSLLQLLRIIAIFGRGRKKN